MKRHPLEQAPPCLFIVRLSTKQQYYYYAYDVANMLSLHIGGPPAWDTA